nr:hypothetical protein [Sedimentibacter sp.]
MFKKLVVMVLASVMAMSMSATAFASENDSAATIPSNNIMSNYVVEPMATYEHTFETDRISDNLGYYDYSIRIEYNLDSNGKFSSVQGYITKYMNLLATNPNYTVICEINNATHSISSNKEKITIKFDMDYEYIPDWFGSGWTETKTYVLDLSDI